MSLLYANPKPPDPEPTMKMNLMRTITPTALGAALLLACAPLAAQVAPAAPVAVPVLQVEKEDTVANFVGAAQHLMGAQAALLAALGMAPEADKLAATAQALAPDAARAALEEAVRQQDAANAALLGKMGGPATLDPAARQKFADALRTLAEGYTQYAALAHARVATGQRPDGADASSEQFIASKVPGMMQSVLKTLRKGVEFSKANGLVVSPVVAEILSRR